MNPLTHYTAFGFDPSSKKSYSRRIAILEIGTKHKIELSKTSVVYMYVERLVNRRSHFRHIIKLYLL